MEEEGGKCVCVVECIYEVVCGWVHVLYEYMCNAGVCGCMCGVCGCMCCMSTCVMRVHVLYEYMCNAGACVV